MDESNPLTSIAERLGAHASVESVYGEPIEHGDRTVVPVATIGYGFGGGYGSEDERDGATGAGGGGGVSAKPRGVLELTDRETRFVGFASREKMLLALVVGLVAGFLWGRR